jgi:hypothetical protein
MPPPKIATPGSRNAGAAFRALRANPSLATARSRAAPWATWLTPGAKSAALGMDGERTRVRKGKRCPHR